MEYPYNYQVNILYIHYKQNNHMFFLYSDYIYFLIESYTLYFVQDIKK